MALSVNTYTLPLGETTLDLKSPAAWEQSVIDSGGQVAICILEDDEGLDVSETFRVVQGGSPLPSGAWEYIGSIAVGGLGVRHAFRGRG